MAAFTCRKNAGFLRGGSPLSFIPALTACTSERMKTFRFSYLSGFAARELMREAKPEKLEKVALSHFFDNLKCADQRRLYACITYCCSIVNGL